MVPVTPIAQRRGLKVFVGHDYLHFYPIVEDVGVVELVVTVYIELARDVNLQIVGEIGKRVVAIATLLERIGLDLMLFHNVLAEFILLPPVFLLFMPCVATASVGAFDYSSSGALGKTEDQKGSSSSGC